MHILVTGGAGFIGSHMVRLLLAEGHAVLNIDKLTYAGNLSSLADVASHANYVFLKADICDASAMRNAFASFAPDAVIHLAAESHVDRSIDGPAGFIETNVHGTCTLLECSRHYLREHPAAAAAFRFLHLSTDEVFGSLGERGCFTAGSTYAPRSPYSASKAAADQLVRAWHATYGMPSIIVHSSNAYGPYQFPEKLIPHALLKAIQGEPIPIYGHGEQIREWLHVEDLAAALHAALTMAKPGSTYLIGSGEEMRNLDLVESLCAILDDLVDNGELDPALRRGASFAEQITFVADRPGHDFRYASDSSPIRRDCAWQPRHRIHTGLRSTIQWYLQNRAWWQPILSGEYHLERQGNMH